MDRADPPADLAPLFDELCADLGVCLGPDQRQRLAAADLSDADALADAALVAAGLDPWLDRRLRRLVLERASRYRRPAERPARDPGLERLLDDLCANGGYCLPPDAYERIAGARWEDPEALATAILVAEGRPGFDPRYEGSAYEGVYERVRRHFHPAEPSRAPGPAEPGRVRRSSRRGDR